jgi:hypothetical protein
VASTAAVCNEDSSQFLDPGEFKALMQDLQPLAPDSLDFNRGWANYFFMGVCGKLWKWGLQMAIEIRKMSF